jgi:hypothetical protein
VAGAGAATGTGAGTAAAFFPRAGFGGAEAGAATTCFFAGGVAVVSSCEGEESLVRKNLP